ncbi:PREDICTED: uncharacterized protein LOC101309999 [Fragaria vesca subsp. vesca]
MKLKVGNSVEVLRKENNLCMSWFSGKVIAVDGDDFIVRYKSLMDCKGVMAVERVCRKDIRPKPLHAKKRVGWIVGDMVEVFDTKCWKVGKVTKVAKNNRVVIRFLESIQLKEFDECNLRIRQAWDQNKWSVTEKVHKKNQIKIRSSNRWNDLKVQLEASSKERCSKERKISCKRSNIYEGASDRPSMANHMLYMQVDKTSTNNSSTEMDPKMRNITSSGMHRSFELTQCTEDSYQCSVASCSLNELSDSQNECSAELGEDVGDSSDAESSFPALTRKKFSAPLPEPDHMLDVDIHKLELQAYKSTLQVLYASGPLSWEQESLLTNLRLSLHITNEEHLLHLRHLLSSQVL